MPEIQFGAGAYLHDGNDYGLPSIALENWFPEEAPDRPDWGYRLVPTPGLVEFTTTGSGGGRGLFQSDAVSASKFFSIRQTTVFQIDDQGNESQITGGGAGGAVALDTIAARFASSQSQIVLNTGGNVYTLTESAVTNFTAALGGAGASGDIIDVDTINNRHLFVEDNSGRLFYSAAGNASSIAGFVTAESDPDQLRAVLVVGASALLLGAKKTEVWTGTDSALSPLRPRQGFVLDVGIISKRAKCTIDGVAYFVANNGTVYEWAGGGHNRISGHWMERAIKGLSPANAALVRMTAHFFDGHKFIKLFVPGLGDFFFDALTREWHRRKPLLDANVHWDFDYFVEAFGRTFVQRLSDGRVCRIDSSFFTEAGEPVKRVATALVPIKRKVEVKSLVVEGQAGIGLDVSSGQGSRPVCNLRVAHDGRTFGDQIQREIGRFGQWRARPNFGHLGTFLKPVAALQLSYAEPVGWSVYGATFNEEIE